MIGSACMVGSVENDNPARRTQKVTKIARALACTTALTCLVVPALAQDQQLTIWTISYQADAQVNALKRAEEAFEASHPGVDVEIVMRGVDEHKTALRVAAGSDSGPDIYMSWAGLGLGGEYVKAGLSADMSEYYDQYGWSERLSAPSLAFNSAFSEGKHGIPFRFSGEGLYYNKALFDEAGITEVPATYDELVEVAEQLKQAGIAPITFGGTVNWHVMRLMDMLLEAKCGAETNDALMGMQADWNTTPCATEAFAELQKWGADYILSPFMGIDEAQSNQLYYAGRAAMALQGDWFVNQLDENTDDLDNFGVFELPTGTDRLYGFAEYWYIAARADDPDLAAEFLDLFTSDEFQDQIKGAFGALSVNVNVEVADDAPAMYGDWVELFRNAKGTFVNGDQAFPLDVTTEYFRVINEVVTGNMEPAAGAAAMQTFIDNLG